MRAWSWFTAAIKKPGLVSFTVEAIVAGVLAWILPDGINLLLEAFQGSKPPPTTHLERVLTFLSSFLFLYGIQVTHWAEDLVQDGIPQLARATSSVVAAEVREAFEASLSGIVAKAAATSPATAIIQVRIINKWITQTASYPPFLHPILLYLAEERIDDVSGLVNTIQATGVMIGLEDQIQIVQSYLADAGTYVLTDATVYNDVESDWTPAWKRLLKWIPTCKVQGAQYVILASPTASTPAGALTKMRALAKFLKPAGFTTYYCDPQDLLNVDPATDLHNYVAHFMDDVVVSMPQTPVFTGGIQVNTKVYRRGVREDRFLDNVRRYMKPVR